MNDRFAITPREWSRDASCAQTGPDDFLWFGDRDSTSYTDARRICHSCPVRRECLVDALERDDKWGMYGGLTPRQRQALKRRGAA